MTKQELIDKIAEVPGVGSQAEVEAALNAGIEAITEALAGGEVVDLAPLGRFVPRSEAAHQGSDPRTHEPIEVGAQTRILFHPAGALRDAVNAQKPEPPQPE
jgi:DNA-binding protein HU-beta